MRDDDFYLKQLPERGDFQKVDFIKENIGNDIEVSISLFQDDCIPDEPPNASGGGFYQWVTYVFIRWRDQQKFHYQRYLDGSKITVKERIDFKISIYEWLRDHEGMDIEIQDNPLSAGGKIPGPWFLTQTNDKHSR